MNRLITCLVFSMFWSLGYSVTQAPRLLRACLDINDSTVTITYSGITDACNSFSEHHIFGSETGSTFSLLDNETSLAATTVKVKLPNANPTWYFYFVTRYACDGSTTYQSNTIRVDTKKPELNEIDSVSIDLLTQKPVIGWKPNVDLDVMGYRLYTTSNGINSTLDDTDKSPYVVNNQSSTTKVNYKLAAFDSCNLFSIISSSHAAMVLGGKLDTCTKSIQLTWSKYEGWAVENQTVYYSVNGAPFQSNNLLSSDLSYNYSGVNFGDSVCFYVRARNVSSGFKSSASNITCHKLSQPVIPKVTYLSLVSVVDETNTTVEAYIENAGVADSVVLYSVTGLGETKIDDLVLNQGAEFYTWNDDAAKNNSEIKTYFVRTFAPCLGGTSSSLASRNILLTIDGDELNWNTYENWDGSIIAYDVYGYDGSTWNIIGSTLETTFENTDTLIQCFYVQAVENQNRYGFSRTSKSNEVCAKRTPVFFVPNTLNPLSHNHTLRVIGPSIDSTRSTMIVFNRWGEQIFQTNNVKQGWSVEAPQNFIPLGIYFYDMNIFDLNGNKHKVTGSVRVIR